MSWITLSFPPNTSEEDIKKALETFLADPSSFSLFGDYRDSYTTYLKSATFLKSYKGQHKKKPALKVVVEVDSSNYCWYEADIVSQVFIHQGITCTGAYNHYSQKPNTLKSKQEKKEIKKKNKEAKEKKEKKIKDAKENGIEVTIPLELYKITGHHYRASSISFVFRFYLGKMTVNYEFYQSKHNSTWHKAKGGWPGMKNVEACTPLEFLIATGMTITEVLSKYFKIELPEYTEEEEEATEKTE